MKTLNIKRSNLSTAFDVIETLTKTTPGPADALEVLTVCVAYLVARTSYKDVSTDETMKHFDEVARDVIEAIEEGVLIGRVKDIRPDRPDQE